VLGLTSANGSCQLSKDELLLVLLLLLLLQGQLNIGKAVCAAVQTMRRAVDGSKGAGARPACIGGA
jgi:hypothetical protein